MALNGHNNVVILFNNKVLDAAAGQLPIVIRWISVGGNIHELIKNVGRL